jgi:hypothetical protein
MVNGEWKKQRMARLDSLGVRSCRWNSLIGNRPILPLETHSDRGRVDFSIVFLIQVNKPPRQEVTLP